MSDAFTLDCIQIENEVLASIICSALEYLSHPDFSYGLTGDAVRVLEDILRGEDDDDESAS